MYQIRLLCHAVGQGCGTVHVETHAIGLVVYELTAIVRMYGIDDCEQMLIKRINEYQTYLLECAKRHISINGQNLLVMILMQIRNIY